MGSAGGLMLQEPMRLARPPTQRRKRPGRLRSASPCSKRRSRSSSTPAPESMRERVNTRIPLAASRHAPRRLRAALAHEAAAAAAGGLLRGEFCGLTGHKLVDKD